MMVYYSINVATFEKKYINERRIFMKIKTKTGKFIITLVVSVLCLSMFTVSAFASDLSTSQANVVTDSSQAPALQGNQLIVQPMTAQANVLTIPGGQGTLTSNCWRQTTATQSGNTLQWAWQVSAVYSGTKTVQSIKTEWYSTASLRNSASISMGISADGGSASASSSWQTISTVKKYWNNTNGATESDYLGNIAIGPSVDYRSSTICTFNTAYVKLSSDPKTYSITASV